MKNQSEFLEINYNLLKAHQKLCVQHAIGFGFGFGSHLLKNWNNIFQPITKHGNCNHVISLYSHLETVLKNKCKNFVIFCQGMVVQFHCSGHLILDDSLMGSKDIYVVWGQAVSTHGGCNKNLNSSTIDELVSWYHLKACLSVEVIFRAEWGVHGDPNSRQVTLIQSFQSNNCQNWGVTEGKAFNRASKVAVQ